MKDYLFGSTLLLSIAACVCVAVYAIIHKTPYGDIAPIETMLGNIITLLLGYKYGSSQGSKDKAALLNKPA